MQYASRISACRRGLSGHEAAKPREHGCPQERGRQQASSERGQAENQTTLLQPSRGEASAAANKNYLEPLCYIEPAHCVGSSGVQSVGGAAAVRAWRPTVGAGLTRTLGGAKTLSSDIEAAQSTTHPFPPCRPCGVFR